MPAGPRLPSLQGIGKIGMWGAAPVAAFAGGYAVGGAMPDRAMGPAEGNITDVRKGNAVRRMNFSTAGIGLAIHNNRRAG